MEKRRLGSSDLMVAPLVLGGNVFGWTADEKTSFDLLDAFVDAGGDMIDTADTYSAWAPGNRGGESETLIGRWLKRSGKRDKVLIATKVGFVEGLAPEAIDKRDRCSGSGSSASISTTSTRTTKRFRSPIASARWTGW